MKRKFYSFLVGGAVTALAAFAATEVVGSGIIGGESPEPTMYKPIVENAVATLSADQSTITITADIAAQGPGYIDNEWQGEFDIPMTKDIIVELYNHTTGAPLDVKNKVVKAGDEVEFTFSAPTVPGTYTYRVVAQIVAEGRSEAVTNPITISVPSDFPTALYMRQNKLGQLAEFTQVGIGVFETVYTTEYNGTRDFVLADKATGENSRWWGPANDEFTVIEADELPATLDFEEQDNLQPYWTLPRDLKVKITVDFNTGKMTIADATEERELTPEEPTALAWDAATSTLSAVAPFNGVDAENHRYEIPADQAITITFYNGEEVLGTKDVARGQTAKLGKTLPAGTYTVTAKASIDGRYSEATEAITFTVEEGSTTPTSLYLRGNAAFPGGAEFEAMGDGVFVLNYEITEESQNPWMVALADSNSIHANWYGPESGMNVDVTVPETLHFAAQEGMASYWTLPRDMVVKITVNFNDNSIKFEKDEVVAPAQMFLAWSTLITKELKAEGNGIFTTDLNFDEYNAEGFGYKVSLTDAKSNGKWYGPATSASIDALPKTVAFKAQSGIDPQWTVAAGLGEVTVKVNFYEGTVEFTKYEEVIEITPDAPATVDWIEGAVPTKGILRTIAPSMGNNGLNQFPEGAVLTIKFYNGNELLATTKAAPGETVEVEHSFAPGTYNVTATATYEGLESEDSTATTIIIEGPADIVPESLYICWNEIMTKAFKAEGNGVFKTTLDFDEYAEAGAGYNFSLCDAKSGRRHFWGPANGENTSITLGDTEGFIAQYEVDPQWTMAVGKGEVTVTVDFTAKTITISEPVVESLYPAHLYMRQNTIGNIDEFKSMGNGHYELAYSTEYDAPWQFVLSDFGGYVNADAPAGKWYGPANGEMVVVDADALPETYEFAEQTTLVQPNWTLPRDMKFNIVVDFTTMRMTIYKAEAVVPEDLTPVAPSTVVWDDDADSLSTTAPSFGVDAEGNEYELPADTDIIITFYDGDEEIGTVTVKPGQTARIFKSLGEGTHNITAKATIGDRQGAASNDSEVVVEPEGEYPANLYLRANTFASLAVFENLGEGVYELKYDFAESGAYNFSLSSAVTGPAGNWWGPETYTTISADFPQTLPLVAQSEFGAQWTMPRDLGEVTLTVNLKEMTLTVSQDEVIVPTTLYVCFNEVRGVELAAQSNGVFEGDINFDEYVETGVTYNFSLSDKKSNYDRALRNWWGPKGKNAFSTTLPSTLAFAAQESINPQFTVPANLGEVTVRVDFNNNEITIKEKEVVNTITPNAPLSITWTPSTRTAGTFGLEVPAMGTDSNNEPVFLDETKQVTVKFYEGENVIAETKSYPRADVSLPYAFAPGTYKVTATVTYEGVESAKSPDCTVVVKDAPVPAELYIAFNSLVCEKFNAKGEGKFELTTDLGGRKELGFNGFSLSDSGRDEAGVERNYWGPAGDADLEAALPTTVQFKNQLGVNPQWTIPAEYGKVTITVDFAEKTMTITEPKIEVPEELWLATNKNFSDTQFLKVEEGVFDLNWNFDGLQNYDFAFRTNFSGSTTWFGPEASTVATENIPLPFVQTAGFDNHWTLPTDLGLVNLRVDFNNQTLTVTKVDQFVTPFNPVEITWTGGNRPTGELKTTAPTGGIDQDGEEVSFDETDEITITFFDGEEEIGSVTCKPGEEAVLEHTFDAGEHVITAIATYDGTDSFESTPKVINIEALPEALYVVDADKNVVIAELESFDEEYSNSFDATNGTKVIFVDAVVENEDGVLVPADNATIYGPANEESTAIDNLKVEEEDVDLAAGEDVVGVFNITDFTGPVYVVVNLYDMHAQFLGDWVEAEPVKNVAATQDEETGAITVTWEPAENSYIAPAYLENYTVVITDGEGEVVKTVTVDADKTSVTIDDFDGETGEYTVTVISNFSNGQEEYSDEATLEYVGIEILGADSDAVYFNLNGNKVVNPENGLYIRVANGKSVKVIIKK